MSLVLPLKGVFTVHSQELKLLTSLRRLDRKKWQKKFFIEIFESHSHISSLGESGLKES